MISQASRKFEKRWNFGVGKMAERTVIDALATCAVKRQDGVVQSVASLSIRSIIGSVLD